MAEDTVRAHVFISGTVQDVGFRATTVEQAEKHDVNGWVKNLADGRVEAVFEGGEENVQQIIDFCRDGPSRAHVKDVTVEWEQPHGREGFERRN